MSSKIDLQSTIIQKVIEPALETKQLQDFARQLGYDIRANFSEYEFKSLNKRFFDEIIKPRIQLYLKSPEAPKWNGQILPLNIITDFETVVHERLKKICKIIPGSWGSYPVPEQPSLVWTWVASLWKNEPSSLN